MTTIKLTGIVPKHCTQNSIGFRTDPEVTPEVIADAKSRIESGSTLVLDLSEGVLIVTGTVWPPTTPLFKNLQEWISYSYDQLQEEKSRKEANHKSIVEQYARTAGLPIVD